MTSKFTYKIIHFALAFALCLAALPTLNVHAATAAQSTLKEHTSSSTWTRPWSPTWPSRARSCPNT
jgi:hypothetical protein